MKKSTFTYIISAIILGVIMMYTFSGNEESYTLNINKSRKEYVFSLVNAANSPLEKGKEFVGLNYYDPDPKYLTEAKVSLIDEYKTIELTTNSGNNRFYRYFANLDFRIDDKKYSLVLLQNAEDETDFFLPFFDETNGETTYGAGRYLPVEYKMSGTITLDFNLSFNPYCVYNQKYICPIPPKENALALKIEAGEKYNPHYYKY